AIKHNSPGHRFRPNYKSASFGEGFVEVDGVGRGLGWGADRRYIVKPIAVAARDVGHFRRAKPRRRFSKSVEHSLEVESRTANQLENIRGRGLLLQRLPQFIEQPGVLDGDDGLISEILHQRDLFVGERTYLLPVDANDTDQRIVLERGHGDE